MFDRCESLGLLADEYPKLRTYIMGFHPFYGSGESLQTQKMGCISMAKADRTDEHNPPMSYCFTRSEYYNRHLEGTSGPTQNP